MRTKVLFVVSWFNQSIVFAIREPICCLVTVALYNKYERTNVKLFSVSKKDTIDEICRLFVKNFTNRLQMYLGG